MKTILKSIALLMAAIIILIAGAVLYVVGLHWSIVRHEPGGLAVGPAPGVLGSDVNVFSGTGGIPYVCAYDTPAATTPFGMVRLGPDTASMLIDKRCLNAAGYHYADNKIIGFSHTRLVGADAEEGGHFRILPTVDGRAEKAWKGEYLPHFSHREETAFPGFYAVRLPKEKVLVELTATPRAGVHRYTFNGKGTPHLLLDVTSLLGSDRRRENGEVWIDPEKREIEGSVRTYGSFAGRYGGVDVYFAAQFSQPFTTFATWNGGTFAPNAQSASGDHIGVDLTFDQAAGPVEVRLALSYVSTENAHANLEAEAADKTFDEVAKAAGDAWEARLALIRIQGGTPRQQRIFYTALYHAFVMPTLFTDVNGQYRGFDKAVHEAEGFQYYTDFSMWDTFRTVHPLFNLIARADQRDMMQSLVEMAKAGGALPRWPAGCGYTNCMMGTPSDVTVTEAWLKGIRDFDIETAYKAMRQTALIGKPEGSRFGGRSVLNDYLLLGYCPSEKTSKAVSRTLEFCWEDYALSLLAKELGHEEDAKRFAEHAQFYRNLWNPETQYFQPRDSQGRFQEEFKPLLLSYADFKGKYTQDYCEGSALQWRWAVPHDPKGLISLFESPEYFISELDAFFANATDTKMAAWNPGVYYWHGNEPDLHSAYLFNEAGRPDLTQKWVRWILENRYDDNYVGLDGNDDGGTLSAWYVLSALGFYPIAGTTRYELGAPLFEKAEVRIGENKLTIIAGNHAPENIYVQRVALNDEVLDRTWFTHDEIADGGTLRFEMGPEATLH